MNPGRTLATIAASALLLMLSSHPALAQYPPPTGNLVCAVSQSRLLTNTSTVLTVTLRDSAGNVVPNRSVSFTITRSNGTASLSSDTAITDANGAARVTISMGANTGSVEVTAVSNSQTCRTALNIEMPTPPRITGTTPTPPGNKPPPARTPPAGSGGGSSGGASLSPVSVSTTTQIVRGPIYPPVTGDAGLASEGLR